MSQQSSDFAYGNYLKIPELLDLQQLVSLDPETGQPEHDEMLFIVIHQVYELWFKQVLHELDHIIELLKLDRIGSAKHHLRRVLTILRTMVGQVDILETMTPAEFASFRSFLANASGFQSSQFRELEFMLGIKDRVLIDWFSDADAERLEARHAAPTIWDSYVGVLARLGFDVPDEVLNRDVREPIVENAVLQKTMIENYTHESTIGLTEMMTDLDARLQEWRYRHVMMVRRTIGTKPGTGGSDGASYLQTTLFKPAFPDLWAIRTAF